MAIDLTQQLEGSREHRAAVQAFYEDREIELACSLCGVEVPAEGLCGSCGTLVELPLEAA